MIGLAANLWAMQRRGAPPGAVPPPPPPTGSILDLFNGGVPGFYFRRDESQYFQSSSGTTTAVDGDQVGYIGDLSPNGFNATQSSSLWSGVLTSQGVEFDGVDDYYSIPVAAVGDASSSNTLVAVVRLDVVSGIRTIIDGENTFRGFVCRFNTGKIQAIVSQPTGTIFGVGTTVVADGNLHIVSYRYDRANQRLIGRVNGVTEVDLATADADKTDPGSVLRFGVQGNLSSTSYFDGIIGDTLQIAKALTDAELSMVEAEFAARWGVTLP